MNKQAPYDILVIDDEEDICHLLSGILEDEGYRAEAVRSSEAAFDFFKQREDVKVAIVDVWLDNSEDDGLKILEVLRRDYPTCDVLMMSGHSTIDIAVRAIQMGARDFITKPFRSDVLLHTIRRLLDERRMREENSKFRKREQGVVGVMLGGKSKVVRILRDELKKSLKVASNILLEGEMGVGKSSLGRYIHYNDKREGGNLVLVNCGLEMGGEDFDRIFGGNIKGEIIDSLKGGTLMLEDIDTLSTLHQKRLLQGLLAHQQQVNWGDKGRYRLISTSRNNLQGLVENDLFDESLYYRLSIIRIAVPPFRNRKQDIAELITEMVKERSIMLGRHPRVLTREALLLLQGGDWRGNFYQLESLVDKLLLEDGEPLPIEGGEVKALLQEAIDEQEEVTTSSQPIASLFDRDIKEAKDSFEKLYLKHHLGNCGGNVSRLSEVSGIERTALHRKLRKLDVRYE